MYRIMDAGNSDSDPFPPPEAPVTSNSPAVVSLEDVETVEIVSLPRSRDENGTPSTTRTSIINNNTNRRHSIFPDPRGSVVDEEDQYSTPLPTQQVLQTIPQSAVHVSTNNSPLSSESPPPYPGLQNTFPTMASRTNDVPIIRNNNARSELNHIPTVRVCQL